MLLDRAREQGREERSASPARPTVEVLEDDLADLARAALNRERMFRERLVELDHEVSVLSVMAATSPVETEQED